MMQIRHSDNLRSRCSNTGNCIIFRVQIVPFAAVQFFEAGNAKKFVGSMHFLLYSEQENSYLARYLQELDAKNAFSYEILQEFL